MNQKEKLISNYGIDIGKPNLMVFFILIIIVAIEIGLVYSKQKNIGIWESLDAIIFVFAWFSLLTTPIVEWLRNIYILIGWFLICIIWYFYKVDQDFLTAILPFSVLIYSQISRLLFKSIMGYHPIHLLFHQYAIHRYSKFNNRKSTKVDYLYSMIYSVTGLVLTIIIVI